ncbi:MAG: cohesin domain-containing protein [Saccharofermentanales bacterium]
MKFKPYQVRIVGFTLALLLVVGQWLFFPVYVSGDSVHTNTVFTAGSAEVKAGDTVEVPIFIKDCAPFFALGLKIDYDRNLELISIELHEDLKPSNAGNLDLPDDISRGVLNFIKFGSGNTRFEDGPVFSLSFSIPLDVPPGNYKIGLAISSAGWVNWEEQFLSGSFVDGTLQITNAGNPATYDVIFAGGPGATGTSPSLSDKLEGEAFFLPENSFQKEGFSFVGWHDGVSLYDAGDSYTMPGHAVTLTAHWKEDIPSGHKEPDVQPLIDPNDVADRDLTVEVTEGGIIVGGKDLSGLSFDVNTPGGKVRVDLDTEEKEVLIQDRGKEGLEVFIDADGDGVFETSIGRFALRGNRVFLIAALIVLGLSACLIGFLIYRRRRKRT